jgi:diadenosine tetraphosphate (Ap4A) HIT family hydrolase
VAECLFCAIVAGETPASTVLAGYRVVFNTGAQAGQTVPHVHGHVPGGRYHLAPRMTGPEPRPGKF